MKVKNVKLLTKKMMINNNFPKDFLFGTSTSAFQIEGAGDTEWKNFVGEDGTKLDTALKNDYFDFNTKSSDYRNF